MRSNSTSAAGGIASPLLPRSSPAVSFVVRCPPCRDADLLGDEEECALRDHLLAVHPQTVQPATLSVLLEHFAVTEPPRRQRRPRAARGARGRQPTRFGRSLLARAHPSRNERSIPFALDPRTAGQRGTGGRCARGGNRPPASAQPGKSGSFQGPSHYPLGLVQASKGGTRPGYRRFSAASRDNALHPYYPLTTSTRLCISQPPLTAHNAAR